MLLVLPESFVLVADAAVLVEVPEAVIGIVGMVSACDPDVTPDELDMLWLGDALVSVVRVLPVVAEGSKPVMLLGTLLSVSLSVGAAGLSVIAVRIASVALGSVAVVCWIAREVEASAPLSGSPLAAGGGAPPVGALVGEAPASGVASPPAAAAAVEEPQ